jgi:UDP-3-O-acyl-N-acetylglucosamine deacetylase
VSVIPAVDLNISYVVNFNHRIWSKMVSSSLRVCVMKLLMPDFGYLRDWKKFRVWAGSGGQLENTVGLTDDGYTVALRSEFEPAKHKILDLIGDFMLTGVNPLSLNAIIIAKEAGHFLHVEAAKLMKNSIIQKEKI